MYLRDLEDGNKPTITDYIESVIVAFLNKHNLGFHKGSGGEEDIAKSALKKSVAVGQFVHEHRSSLKYHQLT